MVDLKKYNGTAWVDTTLRQYKTATDTITTLPADLYADGNNATVGLVGNMSQTGTPTPQNPIQPSETGERTRNLFDADTIYSTYKQSDGTYQAARSVFYGLKVKPFSAEDIGKTFTFAMTISPVSGNVRVCGNIGGAVINGDSAARSVITFTVASVDDTLYLNYGSGGDVVTTLSDTMLNSGSSPLPYEPYGVKIPISSAGQTTPVYLGEVQTTRKIKKVVFTGSADETWEGGSLDNKMRYIPIPMITNGVPLTEAISTHFAFGGFNANSGANGTITGTNSSSAYRMYFWSSDYATVDAWKSYLAQQYANGTPVTVWYALAEPTTGIVNEPLRKIGDYADSVSVTNIPTTTGKDTFDVLTTLKPSEVELTYTGWHDASVKEWNGSDWQ